ncbi:MAG: hypothetical protein IJL76_02725 [Bacilli bacterium]|nr:hypothetical protein [Bacilli bacterium]
MKIQKGLVKYKDRSDIVCTYGITDDGRQFYFLNDSKLSNNNIIVTSTLVEAIDSSVVHANVGLIDAEGNIVIPCENKNIKLITKDILLVEKSTPVSQCVIDACETRKDPLAATKLVSTTALVKDKVFSEMGTDGRFLFNDQFSEASLYDLDGKNLVEDKFYSFIAINKNSDTIFLSDNTKESPVDKFSLTTMTLNDTTNVPQGEVPENAGFTDIDVNDANVTKEEIDTAMNGEEIPKLPEDGVEENAEVSQEATSETPVDVTAPVAQEDAVQVPEGAPEVPVTPEVEAPQVPISEVPAQEVAAVAGEAEIPTPYDVVEAPVEDTDYVSPVTEVPSPYEVVDTPPVEEEEEANFSAVTTDSIVTEEEPITIPTINYDKFNVVDEEEEKVEKIEDDNLLDEVNFDHKFETQESDNLFGDLDNAIKEEPRDKFDDFLNDLTKKDDVRNLDVRSHNYNDSYSYSAPKSGTSIMDSAALTISKLIEANKNQMNELDEYKNQVQELTDLNRKVVDRAKEDRERIRSSIQNYEDQIDRLKAQMDSLEDRVRDKERIINSQSAELTDLRSQVEGSNNLAKILEDAQSILGNDRY